MTNNSYFKYIIRFMMQEYILKLGVEPPKEHLEELISSVNITQLDDRELLNRMDDEFIEKYLREKKLKKINKK